MGESLAGTQESRVWRQFRRHRLALVGTVMLCTVVGLATLAPVISRHDPNRVNLAEHKMPPSARHPLGTDGSGRDVLSRLLHAGRVSLSVGVVAVGVYVAIGTVLGSMAGYFGGWVDGFVMRLGDMVMSFPSLLVIITATSILGPSIYNIMLVIGLLGWPPIARIVRGQFLSLREREFVVAARAVGAGGVRIVGRHLLPNAVAPVIVAATYGAATAILIEAALSFLGLGVQPPQASWGNMLEGAQAIHILEGLPWLWLPPGIMITITILSLNFLGDGLRDALDPLATKSG